MRCAPIATWGFFPLDEELQLLPGQLTPALEESLVHLGTWMPFGRAVKELRFFNHVTVTAATVRRDTEAAGAAYVEVQTEAVERIERTQPAPLEGPARQLLSVDGAMVPLAHHEWAEVKTLVLGTVQPPVLEKGEAVVHSTDLSYFSRLADAETFGHLALVETHRRGTERAATVCAVTDGAEWEQSFIDLHRHDAIRILWHIPDGCAIREIFRTPPAIWRKSAKGPSSAKIGCMRRCKNSSRVNPTPSSRPSPT